MRYDAEDLLDDLLAIVQAKLPAKLEAIEDEKISKGKGVAKGLKPIPTNAYYCQTWDNKICNSPAAIYYGIEDVQTTDIMAGASAIKYTVFFEIILTDNNQYNDTHKRIQRYSRALREIFEENMSKNSSFSNTKVETVRPISFKLELDTDDETKVGGVSISTTIIN